MSKQTHNTKPAQLALLILLILLMLVSFFVTFIPVGNAQEPQTQITTTSDGRLCADDEVLVKFEQTVSPSAAESTLEEMASEPLDIASDIIVADVPEGETVESFAESLETLPNVEYAQPNYVYTLERTTVNDTYVSLQWYLETINVFDAWDITMGNSSTVVAVIDTGVDLTHPDLAGQIVSQTDVVAYDGSAQDDDGHGTHVAGIIAAKANNGTGVAGVAPGSKLIAVDVFGNYYNPYTGLTEFGALTSKVIEGIQYAVANGADVINMSLGGPYYDSAFEDAVDDAVNAGVVVVGAAGNESTSSAHYPSDYNSCISVIATNQSDQKADFSNYGAAKDICAPGVSITSTYPGGYANLNGTSMASPVVAGVAALMLSVDPDLTVNELKNNLYSTAVDLGTPGRDDLYGYGRINAQAAVALTGVVKGFSFSPSSISLAIGETLQLTPTFSPINAANKNVSYVSNTPSVATVSASGVITPVAAGTAIITGTTQDGGFQDTCQVTVKSGQIATSVYTIDRASSLLRGIALNTSAAQLKANLNNAPEDINIYTASGALYTGNNVGTGMTVKLEFGTGTHDSLAAVLLGDTSGDGSISVSDYTKIRLHILGLSGLSGAAAAAADADKNGTIDIGDYTLVRLHILGLKSIY